MAQLPAYFIRFLLVIVCFTLSLRLSAQNTAIITKTQLSRVSRTYGYLLGQDHSLDRISSEYPDLKLQTIHASAEFNLVFGEARKNIVNSLKYALGESFSLFEHKFSSQADSILRLQGLNRDLSSKFISEVLDRAKGKISSPELETLLMYQYSTQIESEFLDGYTTTFSTKDHAKSKGTDWKIKIPRSWKVSEAERPNIIQKFTSEFGDGNYTLMLMVKDLPLPKNYKISSKELKELFSKESAISMVPDGGKLISHKELIIDNQQGMLVEFNQTEKRLDLVINFKMMQYVFVHRNKMYFMQALVTKKFSESTLDELRDKFTPLLSLIANSIVINDQY